MHHGAESIFVAIITCVLVSLMGVSLSKLHNASFQSLFSSEATMQAQHYAKTKMDYLVFNGYNSLTNQSKTAINNSDFKDEVDIGSISTDTNGISCRTVKVSVYKGDEALPRASLEQVFYSNDANKYVRNGSSATSNISLNYDKDNDRLYAMVDGEEKSLGGGGGVPIGTVIAWASNTTPTEGGVWLECNGQSCSSYPALVNVLGKSTVPDYRGRFLEGADTAGTVKEAGLPNVSGTFLTVHDISNSVDLINQVYYSGAFSHSKTDISPYSGYTTASGYNEWYKNVFDASRCSSVYGASTTVQPPSVTVRYFIKASQNGSSSGSSGSGGS